MTVIRGPIAALVRALSLSVVLAGVLCQPPAMAEGSGTPTFYVKETIREYLPDGGRPDAIFTMTNAELDAEPAEPVRTPQKPRPQPEPKMARAQLDQDAQHGIVGLDMEIRPGSYPLVKQVFPGTPAYRQGIRPGDYILAINGEPTMDKTRDEVDYLISDVPGERVTFKLSRQSRPLSISLTVMGVDISSLRTMLQTP